MKKINRKEMKLLIDMERNTLGLQLLVVSGNIKLDNSVETILEAIGEVTEAYSVFVSDNEKDKLIEAINNGKDVLEKTYNRKRELMESLTKNDDMIKTLRKLKAYSVELRKHGFTRESLILDGEVKQMCMDITRFVNTYINDELGNHYEALYSILSVYEASLNDNVKAKEENLIEVDFGFKFKKIFCYKEMGKLMLDNGFSAARQVGSHKIYSNGFKTIPVPQHTLGKGLSYTIQKQMLG